MHFLSVKDPDSRALQIRVLNSKARMKTRWISLILSLLISVSAEAATRSTQDLIQSIQQWQNDLKNDQKLANEERDLRLELGHRLIFQIEAKYSEHASRQSINVILADMKKTDSRFSRFLTYLAKSFEESLEPNENPVVFIRDYTEYSSISQPEPWENFARERDYFDGKTSFSANPMTPEDAADEAEEILKGPDVPANILFEKKLSDDFSQSPQT